MIKKVKSKKDNSERWLLTYSDLMNLLLILFILLYSMSSINQGKYDKLQASMNSAMGQTQSVLNDSGGVLPNGSSPDGKQQKGNGKTAPTSTPKPTKAADQSNQQSSGSITSKEDMSYLEESVRGIMNDMNMGVSVGTTMNKTGLTISFADDIFFDSGQATLKDKMKKGLDRLALLLNRIDNQIVIEGHTDNVPIMRSSKFESNWQLSATRAANVAQYLVDNGEVKGSRVSAAGYGQYRPKASNDTAKGRSKNRRIDVIILYDNMAGMEYK